MNSDLERFVRDALAVGVPRERIRAELARGGWPADEIDAALGAWLESDLSVPVPKRRMVLSAREAFVYLVLFATLYVVAFNVGAILFASIERWLPDAARGKSWEPWRNTLRWGAASLLIAFPVFLFASRIIARSLARQPEKRNSGVRRWLTYLTLFIAALVLIGDLVVVVSSMLSGELATRFLLKAAVVFMVAGAVFGHYLGGLRRDEDEPSGRTGSAWFGRAGAMGVVLTLLLALLVAGSPQRARTRELDQRRLRDLETIAQHLRSYHAQEDRLPYTLIEATKVPYAPPGLGIKDPVTFEPYGYQILDSVTVRLEAQFASRDSVGPYGETPALFWSHPKGRYGFRFSVKSGRPNEPLDAYRQ
ncbi:MAG: DUF5671 domain-containing protein [Candidatus Eisenbacteria bacterium]